jgi:hypothetical protein
MQKSFDRSIDSTSFELRGKIKSLAPTLTIFERKKKRKKKIGFSTNFWYIQLFIPQGLHCLLHFLLLRDASTGFMLFMIHSGMAKKLFAMIHGGFACKMYLKTLEYKAV